MSVNLVRGGLFLSLLFLIKRASFIANNQAYTGNTIFENTMLYMA